MESEKEVEMGEESDYTDMNEEGTAKDMDEEMAEWFEPVPDDPLPPPIPCPTIVTRQEWGAKSGGVQRLFKYPVEDVIYSYTETDVCETRDQCVAAMKGMQQKHIAEGFPDIKFNFVIGGDGNIYEGTGWYVRAPENDSYPDLEGSNIEFSHTGYRGDFPTPHKVAMINALYDYGEKENYIAKDARTYIDYLWPTDGL